jgi:hypothetical protein
MATLRARSGGCDGPTAASPDTMRWCNSRGIAYSCGAPRADTSRRAGSSMEPRRRSVFVARPAALGCIALTSSASVESRSATRQTALAIRGRLRIHASMMRPVRLPSLSIAKAARPWAAIRTSRFPSISYEVSGVGWPPFSRTYRPANRTGAPVLPMRPGTGVRQRCSRTPLWNEGRHRRGRTAPRECRRGRVRPRRPRS